MQTGDRGVEGKGEGGGEPGAFLERLGGAKARSTDGSGSSAAGQRSSRRPQTLSRQPSAQVPGAYRTGHVHA